MKKWRNDFKTNNYETGYDLFDDWDLIESSFAQQYGIRLRKKISDMEWGEFSSLLSGLNSETPLGNVVRIRCEKDQEIIKKFSPTEKKIRNEWLKKSTPQINQEGYKEAIESIKNMFIALSKEEKR